MVLQLVAGAIGITTVLNLIEELQKGTALEDLPEGLIKNFQDDINNSPVGKPLAEVGQLFSSITEAVIGLVQMLLYWITPNPSHVADFSALRKSIKFIVSIPLVQVLLVVGIVVVLVGTLGPGTIGVLATNPELLNKILSAVEGFLFEETK